MVNIAVLGYGTVGSGVVEVLNTNKESIGKKAGDEIQIKYVLDLRDFPGDPIQNKIVHDIDIILNDEDIKIVVEAMGGIEPAYTFVKRALLGKKSVCTSNKELVAKHGPELLDMARERDINFLFEASCGGGIPIIRPLNSSLTADEIDEITGILNGTTNYILTKMDKDGSSFEEVLKDAQEKGYAERNPEADVEGHDACRKIAILSSLAFGNSVHYEEIYTEGIINITSEDILYAKELGWAIKLLASSKKEGDSFYAMVAPFLLNKEHPLYNVHGVFNGIFIHGNVLGDAMFYGSGAGKLPTASAVVADVVDCAKHLHRTVMSYWSSKKLHLTSIEEAKRRFFVRAKGAREELVSNIENIFGKVDIVQVPSLKGELGFITSLISEKEYKEKEEKLEGMISRIRIMD
ncbi:homoserine dehydrogenase [bacterium 1XD42-8]|jgi:homoserine dehydrogenase|nr:homoserine dehydrogenase [Lachnospiraceae bacterium]RKJ47409.1 homoserine dehydrogenase [bacterium 1XD42-8]